MGLNALELPVTDIAEYYRVMAGMVIGVMKMQVLIEGGLSPEAAARAILTSYADISPVRYE